MSEAALKATGLIRPGSLITWRYRVRLAGDATRSEVRRIVRQARTEFAATGWRVRSRNNAAPGTGQFIERLSYFMTLVGLTALIVGGAGIANATSAFIDRRVVTVAILKCLGASARTVEGIYLTEILLVTLLAIALALIVGALTPLVAQMLLGDVIPLPLTGRIEPAPLLIAGLFGFLVATAFTLWPLARNPATCLPRHCFGIASPE